VRIQDDYGKNAAVKLAGRAKTTADKAHLLAETERGFHFAGKLEDLHRRWVLPVHYGVSRSVAATTLFPWSLPRERSQGVGRSVALALRAELARHSCWRNAFGCERKDHRYYEIVEDTIRQGFDYRYLIIMDGRGAAAAIQPCFFLDQDLLQGTGSSIQMLARSVRALWPRFMFMRTLMVGCAAGEGHIDSREKSPASLMACLASAITEIARAHGASLVVLKEFPARYRPTLQCFADSGFTRIPSLPMTAFSLSYSSFDDYMNRALSRKTRQDLRKKFRSASRSAPIRMTVMTDVSHMIDALYPLYLAVHQRSDFHFEKLTKEYFCRLGAEMPDKVRFFVWCQNERPIAFSLCMLQGEAIYAEYLGLDYELALDLHLYHYAFRDTVAWAIANGYRSIRSGALNYDPKLHLGAVLDPIDLYVKHTSKLLNLILRLASPLLGPTRSDKTLRKFSNYCDLF